ncbi:MAG: hypothetical protein NTU98_07815 [Bacteroidetes bacterium]|nr:hypothetical protein [Bacteroidota bacterium]
MKSRNLLFPVFIGMIFILSGCGNRELKKDASKIGDLMCRNIEVMNKLRATDPADTITTAKLQAQGEQIQNEMQVVYKEFGEKYKDKTKDPKFGKAFNRELRKAMLDCPHLSKKDRELFEKDLEE